MSRASEVCVPRGETVTASQAVPDWHGAGPPHTDPGQHVWRAEGSEGQQGQGLGGSRPGQAGSGLCTVLGACCLPALPTAPAAARAQVQADALPETHPRALPRPPHGLPRVLGLPHSLPTRPLAAVCWILCWLSSAVCRAAAPLPTGWREARERGSGWEGAWPRCRECAFELHLAASCLKVGGGD